MKRFLGKVVLAGACAAVFPALAFSAVKFDHAEYLKPKAEDQKKDQQPIKGSISFDKDKKTVEFADEKGNVDRSEER